MTDPPAVDPFTADVVSAVCAHMNDDHPADTLVICRALGRRPDATAARMVDLDADGGDYEVESANGRATLRIPWHQQLTSRGEVRVEVVRLYQEACAQLGVVPASGGEH